MQNDAWMTHAQRLAGKQIQSNYAPPPNNFRSLRHLHPTMSHVTLKVKYLHNGDFEVTVPDAV